MGEYVRYGGEEIKIGNCECLYYISYDKFLAFDNKRCGGNEREYIPYYLRTEEEFMFRFPFPDEDKLSFGRIIEPHDRAVAVMIDKSVYDKLSEKREITGQSQIWIVMQKPVIRQSDGQFCLALVFKDSSITGYYRVEEPQEAKLIINQMVKHHILNETDTEKKNFYRQIACRILKGYNVEHLIAQRQYLQKSKNVSDSSEAEKSNPTQIDSPKGETIGKTENTPTERSRKKGKKMGR